MIKNIFILVFLLLFLFGELAYGFSQGLINISKNKRIIPGISISEVALSDTTNNPFINYREYLIKFDTFEINEAQSLKSGKTVNSKEDAAAALVEVSKNPGFKQPGPVYGESWEAGFTYFEFVNGFAVSNVTFLRKQSGGSDDAKVYVNNYYITREGVVIFLGAAEYLDSNGEKLTGFGEYWDWKKIRANEFILGLTGPVKGDDIKNNEWADEVCKNKFGAEWLWIDNNVYEGHVTVTARLLNNQNTTQAWVQSFADHWECFEKSGNPQITDKYYNGPVNYPDKFGGGLVSYLTKNISRAGYTDVSWWGDIKKSGSMIGSNYALCSESWPLLCIKSFSNEFYKKREAIKLANIQFNQAQEKATTDKALAVKKSVESGNLEECKKYTKGLRDIAQCQLEAIKLMNNPSPEICKEIDLFNNSDLIKDCNSYFAVKKLDIKLCEDMDCYEAVLRILKNVAECDKFSGQDKASCVYSYVKITGDYKPCATLRRTEDMLCYRYAAVFYKDKKLCAPSDQALCECAISRGDVKGDCENY